MLPMKGGKVDVGEDPLTNRNRDGKNMTQEEKVEELEEMTKDCNRTMLK